MFSESKITEIYCITNDFLKEFASRQQKFATIFGLSSVQVRIYLLPIDTEENTKMDRR